jgi:hypothetical protein
MPLAKRWSHHTGERQASHRHVGVPGPLGQTAGHGHDRTGRGFGEPLERRCASVRTHGAGGPCSRTRQSRPPTVRGACRWPWRGRDGQRGRQLGVGDPRDAGGGGFEVAHAGRGRRQHTGRRCARSQKPVAAARTRQASCMRAGERAVTGRRSRPRHVWTLSTLTTQSVGTPSSCHRRLPRRRRARLSSASVTPWPGGKLRSSPTATPVPPTVPPSFSSMVSLRRACSASPSLTTPLDPSHTTGDPGGVAQGGRKVSGRSGQLWAGGPRRRAPRVVVQALNLNALPTMTGPPCRPKCPGSLVTAVPMQWDTR